MTAHEAVKILSNNGVENLTPRASAWAGLLMLDHNKTNIDVEKVITHIFGGGYFNPDGSVNPKYVNNFSFAKNGSSFTTSTSTPVSSTTDGFSNLSFGEKPSSIEDDTDFDMNQDASV